MITFKSNFSTECISEKRCIFTARLYLKESSSISPSSWGSFISSVKFVLVHDLVQFDGYGSSCLHNFVWSKNCALNTFMNYMYISLTVRNWVKPMKITSVIAASVYVAGLISIPNSLIKGHSWGLWITIRAPVYISIFKNI